MPSGSGWLQVEIRVPQSFFGNVGGQFGRFFAVVFRRDELLGPFLTSTGLGWLAASVCPGSFNAKCRISLGLA